MPDSPYRSPPRAELTFRAGPNQSVFLTLVAGATGLFVARYFVAPWVLALLAVAVVAALVPLGLYTARRNHWRFTLERQRLQIDRLLPSGTKRLGTLDVSKGVSVEVQVPDEDAALEALLTLAAGDERIAFKPGGSTRQLYDELARFLREHEVEVDAPELPKLPEEKLGLPKL